MSLALALPQPDSDLFRPVSAYARDSSGRAALPPVRRPLTLLCSEVVDAADRTVAPLPSTDLPASIRDCMPWEKKSVCQRL